MYHAEHKVTVVKQKRTLAGGGCVYYVKLRWLKPDGGFGFKSLGDRRELTKAKIEDERAQQELDLNTGQADAFGQGPKTTIGEFIAAYAEHRRQGTSGRGYLKGARRLREPTIEKHLMTLRYLAKHFGNDCVMGSITEKQAEAFVNKLAEGELAAARKETKRQYGMGEETVRGHIRNVKAIFTWAVRFALARQNPFAKFDGDPGSGNGAYLCTLAEFESILAKIKRPGERAFYGLCRLAGLRLSEALGLVWSGNDVDGKGTDRFVGVDWERLRLCLVASKTEDNSRSGGYREVPIRPRLAEILEESRQAAGLGRVGVSICGLSGNNLHKRAGTYCKAAGVSKWPDFFQAMRAACENDWKAEGIAEPTYTAWMGHSLKVSREHYVEATAAEFARVTRPRQAASSVA